MRAAASLRERAVGYFVAPAEPRPAPLAELRPSIPMRSAPRAAVLGSPADAPPVAAALANALRAAHGAAAAAVAVWAPPSDAADAASPPLAVVSSAPALARPVPADDATDDRASLPASPAAARLAARLTARGLPAAGRGRLAWLRLADHPVAAGLAARRASGALEVPLVLVLAGPRTDVLEGLLREQDLIVVVTGDPEGALARLAVAGSEVPAVACTPLPHGPARLLALAGLAGARALDTRVRSLAQGLAERHVPPPMLDRARADW